VTSTQEQEQLRLCQNETPNLYSEFSHQIRDVKSLGFSSIKKLSCSSPEEIEPIFGEPVIYEINIDGVLFEMFAHLKQNSPLLYVFGPAAVDRDKNHLPYFPRWSWAINCPYSALSLNDPTLYLGDLKVGWFQGTEKQYYLPLSCNLVTHLANLINLKPEDILFCGSSAGGFSSLMMAAFVREASAFVVNPQTDITRDIKKRVNPLLKTCFSGMTRQEARKKFISRLSVLEYCHSIGNLPRIFYLQNINDHSHWKNHYLPFIQGIGNLILQSNQGVNLVNFHSELYSYSGSHKEGSQAVTYDHWMQRSNIFMQSTGI
jgi:hypothetical protein